MRRIQIVIREADDQTAEPSKELATFDLPTANATALQPETTFDEVEVTIHETGNAILRRLLQVQRLRPRSGLCKTYSISHND